MTSNENEALAERWHMDIVRDGNLNDADELFTSDAVVHVNSLEFRGPEGGRQLAKILRNGVGDMQITHEDIFSSGDKVALRWTVDGVHHGNFAGIPATGKRMHVQGIDIFDLRGGKIAEMFVSFDNVEILQQIGAMPQAQQTTA